MAELFSKSTTASVAVTGLVGAAAYYWATSEPAGMKVNLSLLEQQSVSVDPETPWIRQSPCAHKLDELIKRVGNPQTLYEAFLIGVKTAGNKKCLTWRSSPQTGFDNFLTFNEVLDRCTNIGNGLRHAGLQPTNQTYIGMISKNRAEMVLTQLACYQHSMVIVPMYETLGAEGLEHMLEQTGMEMVFCESEEKVKLILSLSEDSTSKIKSLVSFKEINRELITDVESRGWKFLTFSQLEENGRENKYEQVLCKPTDVFVVCYTSGTTGKPKGAMIQHNGLVKSMLSAFLGSNEMIGDLVVPGADEVHISYLPLAHMYEQLVIHTCLLYGFLVGFYSGDVKLLIDDIKMLKPTIFASVPRLLTKVYDTVISQVSQSCIKSFLFERGLAAKDAHFKRGIITKDTIWDKIVFKKVQQSLGGRVKLIVTGAAPIAAPVLRFLRLAFGAVVVEGYGQTECSAVMSSSLPGDNSTGEVGGPIACCTIKLADVPDMNYLTENMEGEVCVKGANFLGYLNDEVKTAEAVDEEGWLHTGDIGRWTKRGTLQIVDRKKNLFKLSQGEYVAPEKLENVYGGSTLVAQSFVHGDSLKASLVAIVVPDPDALPGAVKSKLKLSDNLTFEELCAHDEVRKLVMQDIISVGKSGGLKGFELIRDLRLHPEPFSVENNLLTPTFKLRRFEARTYFKTVIDDMYARLE